jgi:hypothetical protein
MCQRDGLHLRTKVAVSEDSVQSRHTRYAAVLARSGTEGEGLGTMPTSKCPERTVLQEEVCNRVVGREEGEGEKLTNARWRGRRCRERSEEEME